MICNPITVTIVIKALRSVLERCLEVRAFQIRQFFEDLLGRQLGGEQLQHVRHPDAADVVRLILKYIRPHSFPYITGDGFRRLAEKIIRVVYKILVNGRR